MTVLGGRPGATGDQLARVGSVAQDVPAYSGLSIRDHLRFGTWMNHGWDAALAAERIGRLGLDPRQKTGERRASTISETSDAPARRRLRATSRIVRPSVYTSSKTSIRFPRT